MIQPPIIYGTAWKQGRTAALVGNAIHAGFRAIDTANQKKHYREDYVGDALIEAYQHIPREELFLQSKYTYIEGQDHRLPYDPGDPYQLQVESSFESTLKNLHTEYLDSYLLHGPRSSQGMTDIDWEVWSTMEKIQLSGRVRHIGVSNVGAHHLKELCQQSKIIPAFVQNRCFAVREWDREVRDLCAANGIIYQGFSLLTANPHVSESPAVQTIAQRLGATAEQVIFCFAHRIGILPLTGTTDYEHMSLDLKSFDLNLTQEDVQEILSQ